MQGELDPEELEVLRTEYSQHKASLSPDLLRALQQYDVNKDGVIDENEVGGATTALPHRFFFLGGPHEC